MLGKRGHGMSLGPGFFFGGIIALISGAVPFVPVFIVAMVVGMTVGEGYPKVVAVAATVATLAWWAFIVHKGYGWHLLVMLIIFGISVVVVRNIN